MKRDDPDYFPDKVLRGLFIVGGLVLTFVGLFSIVNILTSDTNPIGCIIGVIISAIGVSFFNHATRN